MVRWLISVKEEVKTVISNIELLAFPIVDFKIDTNYRHL